MTERFGGKVVCVIIVIIIVVIVATTTGGGGGCGSSGWCFPKGKWHTKYRESENCDQVFLGWSGSLQIWQNQLDKLKLVMVWWLENTNFCWMKTILYDYNGVHVVGSHLVLENQYDVILSQENSWNN